MRIGFTESLTATRLASLRLQHREYDRLGYDGHNRRAMALTMRAIAHRRRRRLTNQRLALMVRDAWDRHTSGPVLAA
jgi:hypothetical protein